MKKYYLRFECWLTSRDLSQRLFFEITRTRVAFQTLPRWEYVLGKSCDPHTVRLKPLGCIHRRRTEPPRVSAFGDNPSRRLRRASEVARSLVGRLLQVRQCAPRLAMYLIDKTYEYGFSAPETWSYAATKTCTHTSILTCDDTSIYTCIHAASKT